MRHLVVPLFLFCGFLIFGLQEAKGQKKDPAADIEVLKDIVTGKGGDHDIHLTMYRLKANQEKPMPAIVWIHGGGWLQGAYNDSSARHLALAARGYVVATIEHRFSGEAVFPAAIEDVKCQVRFLRAHAKEYNIDPDHIGAIGASSGAHLVELLGTSGSVKELEGKGGWQDQSSKVQAVVAYAGMTDLVKFGAAGGGKDMTTKFLGGSSVAEKQALAELASPLTHISKDSPPFLLIHGEKDTTVPLIHAEMMRDALQKAGVEVELVVVKGGGHNIVPPTHDAKVNEFLDKHLK